MPGSNPRREFVKPTTLHHMPSVVEALKEAKQTSHAPKVMQVESLRFKYVFEKLKLHF